ncbi:MAG: 4-hydroxybutyrate CoA-transferase [Oscillospiraceae bacterium]|nr:4-hydroxybutyrate CoA-transferase [Oscillospiraceae bacterium]
MENDWKSLYKERLCTAKDAVKRIKSGDRVAASHAAGEAKEIIRALVENKDDYRDVEICQMLPMGGSTYAEPGYEEHFRHISQFVGGQTRATIKAGHGDYTPCYFSQIPNLWGRTLPLNVAIIHVSPPDEHGYMSCGVSVDYSIHAAKNARENDGIVIAQVNKHMPRTLGESFVHVSEIDCIVEHNEPLTELPLPVISDVEREIGRHCASLIKDGDCMQLGIGSIPDAVLLFLKDKKHLGIHTEMFSDGVVELVESGVIDNSAKNFNNGKMVATFLMGTQRLYDFVNNNPVVYMAPSTYTNDPYIAGQNDNLVSINSAIQIDLLGQVCAETIGTAQYSAVGGQVDFVRAAAISKGGRSIIAMPSTASGGKISKIAPFLDQGAAVTTSRNDVEYVVTEHGIANLRYRTMRDRAKSLIRIAHPDFRDQLWDAFEERFNAKADR